MANNLDLVKAVKRTAVKSGGFVPVGDHLQTTINTATDILPALINDDEKEDRVNCVLLQPTVQSCRYTLTFNATPTASKGFLVAASATPVLILLTPGVYLRAIGTAAGCILEYQFGYVEPNA